MREGYKYRSPESEAREKKHQFGRPDGNPICPQSLATNQREFYRWCEAKATQEELKAYAQDPAKPYSRRKFVMALQNCETVQDFFDLTNQTHGQPKQVVETTALPEVQIVLE